MLCRVNRSREVRLFGGSLIDAGSPARKYMPFSQKNSSGKGVKRECVHVEVGFEEPVEGSVLIGVERAFGMGFCWGWE